MSPVRRSASPLDDAFWEEILALAGDDSPAPSSPEISLLEQPDLLTAPRRFNNRRRMAVLRPAPSYPVPRRFNRNTMSPRQLVRHRQFAEMRQTPLQQSTFGRALMRLREYTWYVLPNGLCVMQFEPHESRWRANQMAQYINCLQCGAYAHRSMQINLLAIERLECINERFVRDSIPPILLQEYEHGCLRGRLTQPLAFMRDDYVGISRRRRIAPHIHLAAQDEQQGARQDAREPERT